MSDTAEVTKMVVSILGGGALGFFGAWMKMITLRKKYKLEDSAERVVHLLLQHTNWRLRTFRVIRHHIAGFPDDELRRLLVRAGALRFMSQSGLELWGLLSRNKDRLGVTKVDVDPDTPTVVFDDENTPAQAPTGDRREPKPVRGDATQDRVA
jgi:hypothetical protein